MEFLFGFLRKYSEKILSIFNALITPLVWVFGIVLVLSLFFSMVLKKGSSHSQYTPNSSISTISEETKRPNIILIIMDALTARDMSLYGYKRQTTPFISQWAKEAVVFNRAYATSNGTIPTMMSLMTGQRPWTHRMWYMAVNDPVKKYYKNNLPAVLRDYGYYVYAFVQNRYAHPDTLDIADPFLIKDKAHTFHSPSPWWIDELLQYFADRPIVQEWILLNPIVKTIYEYRQDTDTTLVAPENVYDRFLRYISQNPHQPFFAWLHVFPPHAPYLPPKPFRGVFGDAGKFDTQKKQEKVSIVQKQQKILDILRKRYDEFILYSDKQFEIFLSRLSKTIDMSNTIIILSADHGEIFSHGWWTHGGPHLYEPLVQIPLIMKIPDSILSSRKGGRVINMPVEQIDIAPTILELADIPVPSWMEGRSLLPLLIGETMEPRPIFSMELIKNRSFGHPITKGTIAVWDGNYKLIHYLEEGKSLLFNLKEDPYEQKNILKDKPEIAQRLLRLINEALSRANKRITQAKEGT